MDLGSCECHGVPGSAGPGETLWERLVVRPTFPFYVWGDGPGDRSHLTRVTQPVKAEPVRRTRSGVPLLFGAARSETETVETGGEDLAFHVCPVLICSVAGPVTAHP